MKKINLFCLFIIGLFINLSAQNTALNTFVKLPNLKYAGIGIKVVDLETGNTVCSYNENLSLCPASTLKLLTTASALEILGDKYKFQTSLYAVGNINEAGVLDGFLFITGTGDPSLGSEHLNANKEAFLRDWLIAIQNAGIKKVTGGIQILANTDCYEPVSYKGIIEDIGNYFAPEIYSISVFDNTYRIYLKSGVPGTTTEINRIEPKVDLVFNNCIKAAPNNADSAYIRGLPSSKERFLYGSIPSGKTDFVVKGAIPNPPLFLAEYFQKYLNENGIKVEGNITGTQRQAELNDKLLKVTYSHSLPEIIRITNFKSNNHFAESLFFTIGKEKTNVTECTYIPRQSISYIKDFWKSKGINTAGIFIYDGSGLSPANAITAGLLTDLLVYMNQKSDFSQTFYNSLPEAGKEGTVLNFMRTKNPNITARVKSGSISDVQSYAGYLEKNGKKYAFSIIVNNFTGTRSSVRNQMESFLLNL